MEAVADGTDDLRESRAACSPTTRRFPCRCQNLANYRHLSPDPAGELPSAPEPVRCRQYSRGMGALGLPGDLSSQSRFVRVAFTRAEFPCAERARRRASASSSTFSAPWTSSAAAATWETGKYEITLYTSCCNADRGIYYYTTYDNRQITAVDMHKENLDGDVLIRYPLLSKLRLLKAELTVFFPPDARRRAFFFLCLFCAVWVLPFKRLRGVLPFSKPLVTFLFASRGDSPYFSRPNRRKNPFPLAFAEGLFYNGKVRHLS